MLIKKTLTVLLTYNLLVTFIYRDELRKTNFVPISYEKQKLNTVFHYNKSESFKTTKLFYLDPRVSHVC